MADILTRDALLAACGRRFAEVAVGGGTVRIASLSAAQLLEYHEVREKPDADHVAWLVSASLVEPAIAPEDVGKLDARAVMRLFKEALDLNAMSAEAAEEQRGN